MGVCAYDYKEKRNLLQRIGHGRQFEKLCKEFEDELSLFAKIGAGRFINKMCHFCKTSPFLFFCHDLLGSSHHTLQNPA